MNEVIFIVEEDAEGGYIAKALGRDIFTEANDLRALKININEALMCHFQ